jgi:mRNA interferase RelE/StbE
MNISNYDVIIKASALKKMQLMNFDDKIRIMNKIEELEQNPFEKSNVKKLVQFDISYCMRVGDFRILFERDDSMKIIEIIDIRHRKESYRRN